MSTLNEAAEGIGAGCVLAIFLWLMVILWALPTMWLWNWLMPVVFQLPTLTFWQALGLNALSTILFKNTVSVNNTKK